MNLEPRGSWLIWATASPDAEGLYATRLGQRTEEVWPLIPLQPRVVGLLRVPVTALEHTPGGVVVS